LYVYAIVCVKPRRASWSSGKKPMRSIQPLSKSASESVQSTKRDAAMWNFFSPVTVPAAARGHAAWAWYAVAFSP
jgi:hypothetical protein